MRMLTILAASLLLAACAAHGQSGRLDPEVHRSYTPYSVAFYRELMTGRVNLFEGRGEYRNVVLGQIYGADGTLIECLGRRRLDKRLHWVKQTSTRWSFIRNSIHGVRIEWDFGGGLKRYSSKFYDPETGTFDTEILQEGSYIRANPGQIQETWPRVLADGCPTLKLPAHIRINEKQTSLKMDELRRQDPEAPIRHFPGSHLTAPGRTGLGASGGRPTTTKAEVWAFLDTQEGNILTNYRGGGRVFVRGPGAEHEIWRLDGEGSLGTHAAITVRETADDAGEWLDFLLEGKVRFRYPMGYPFPYLPTGHRHAAFQLTDELVAGAEPVPLPWMGGRYEDHRFLFHDKMLTIVAPGETYLTGRWRWTKGRLQVWVDGEEQHAGSIAWRDLARELGVTPAVWTPSTPDRY